MPSVGVLVLAVNFLHVGYEGRFVAVGAGTVVTLVSDVQVLGVRVTCQLSGGGLQFDTFVTVTVTKLHLVAVTVEMVTMTAIGAVRVLVTVADEVTIKDAVADHLISFLLRQLQFTFIQRQIETQ